MLYYWIQHILCLKKNYCSLDISLSFSFFAQTATNIKDCFMFPHHLKDTSYCSRSLRIHRNFWSVTKLSSLADSYEKKRGKDKMGKTIPILKSLQIVISFWTILTFFFGQIFLSGHYVMQGLWRLLAL